MPRPRSLPSLLACAVLSLAVVAPAAADPLDVDPLAEARELDARGDLPGELRVLEALIPRYPEDHALAIQTAWTLFRLERFADAEREYRRALGISSGSLDARLGLGWSLVRLDRCPEARAFFDEVLQTVPGHASAGDGIKACAAAPPFRLTTTLSLTGHLYQDNPDKGYAFSAFAGLRARILDRWLVGGAFRFSDFTKPNDLRHGVAQYEGYAHLGYARKLWSVQLHYLFASDQTRFSGDSHHGGVSLRVSPWGDGTADLGVSAFSDATVARGELGWRLPLPRGFSLRPAAALQWADTKTYGKGFLGNVSLTLAWDVERGGVFVGGRYGEEFRPAYLNMDLIMNIPERIQWGVWVGGRIKVGGVNLTAAYEYDRLRLAEGQSDPYRDAHFINLGVNFTLPK